MDPLVCSLSPVTFMVFADLVLERGLPALVLVKDLELVVVLVVVAAVGLVDAP